MNQYEKLLNAVNTEPTTQKKPVSTKPSRQSSHSDISEHVVVTSPNKPTKPYVYVSGVRVFCFRIVSMFYFDFF